MLVHAGSVSRTGKMMEWMDASVAPPITTMSISGTWARSRSGRVTGTQSPPRNARRRAGGVAAHQRGPGGGVAQLGGGGDDHGAAGGQDPQRLVDAHVEAEGRQQEHPV